jgi:cytoskeletal protein CcmA (bactofilin family)
VVKVWRRTENGRGASRARRDDREYRLYLRALIVKQVETGGTMSTGQSIVIKGKLTAAEDLTLAGVVEGEIELPNHVLTVGPSARVTATVKAKTITVAGTVSGDVTANEIVRLEQAASVDGSIVAPRLAIAEGARFTGKIDMPKGAAAPVAA